MSQQDIEVVVDQFAGVNERDFARVMDHYAEDVVLFVPPDAFLNPGTFEGREAVGEWFGDWFRNFELDYRFEIEEVRDLGEFVYVDARHHGRGRSSGAEVQDRNGYLYTVRAGKVVRVEIYDSPADALEAAGLPES
jgi:ketosteroid isomerase-like protein